MGTVTRAAEKIGVFTYVARHLSLVVCFPTSFTPTPSSSKRTLHAFWRPYYIFGEKARSPLSNVGRFRFDFLILFLKRHFSGVWEDRDESDNFAQKHDVSLAKDKIRPSVVEEIRNQVCCVCSVEPGMVSAVALL